MAGVCNSTHSFSPCVCTHTQVAISIVIIIRLGYEDSIWLGMENCGALKLLYAFLLRAITLLYVYYIYVLYTELVS